MDISFKFAEQKSILCIVRVFIFIMQLLTRFHPFIFLSGRSAPAGQAGAEGQEKHSEKRWENEASAILTHQKMNAQR